MLASSPHMERSGHSSTLQGTEPPLHGTHRCLGGSHSPSASEQWSSP